MILDKFHVIIPCRFASTRLPGKLLKDVVGKPLIQRVFEQANSYGAESVTIATDDERIKTIAENFGAKVCMTAIHHNSGTERIAEVVSMLNLDDDDIVVNLQGDEPLVPEGAIRHVVKGLLQNPAAKAATLCNKLQDTDILFDPNSVKVVLDKEGYALYFSRAPIPWDRDAQSNESQSKDSSLTACFHHVGLYAYRVSLLKQYMHWPKSPLEEIELLEQLRILWQGEKMHVSVIDEPVPPGVNTEADLERVVKLFEEELKTY